MVNETDDLSGQSVRFDHPDSVSLDEQIPLRTSGLPTDEAVTLVVETDDTAGRKWTVQERYSTADGGLVSQNRPDSDAGTAVDVAKTIQRASGATEERFHPPPSGSVRIAVQQDGRRLDSTTLSRTVGAPDVTAHEIDHPTIIGTVFEPSGDGTAPGVLVLHGSGGRPDTVRARLLASHGFVTAAIQYFGGEGQPDSLVGVPLETVETAIEHLGSHERVGGSQVGVVGTSKGGELALLAGARLDGVGAVVSVNGSGVAWEGIPGGANPFPGSSWTVDGDEVPYVPYARDQSTWEAVLGSFSDPDPPFEYEQAYSQSFEEATSDTIADATIPVESIDGPVLLVSGGEDSMWDSVKLQQVAADRLTRHEHGYESDHLVYDHAGHAISVPYLPTANRSVGSQFVFGGTQQGYARADRHHWPRAIQTLASLSPADTS